MGIFSSYMMGVGGSGGGSGGPGGDTTWITLTSSSCAVGGGGAGGSSAGYSSGGMGGGGGAGGVNWVTPGVTYSYSVLGNGGIIGYIDPGPPVADCGDYKLRVVPSSWG